MHQLSLNCFLDFKSPIHLSACNTMYKKYLANKILALEKSDPQATLVGL